jgi:ssDNA-binding Zn-finger/Zn-ribbon topoisomerase 1
MLVSKGGRAHWYGCADLPDCEYVVPAEWGWIADRATDGAFDAVVAVHLRDHLPHPEASEAERGGWSLQAATWR